MYVLQILSKARAETNRVQMIPSSIKYDGNATPPQWTDNADQVIEKGTHIRVKIKGIRTELGNMYAIATIKEDYLGYVDSLVPPSAIPLILIKCRPLGG